MRLVTTTLDLIGALLVVLGVAWFIAHWSIAAAFIVAGVLLLALSLLIDARRGSQ